MVGGQSSWEFAKAATMAFLPLEARVGPVFLGGLYIVSFRAEGRG